MASVSASSSRPRSCRLLADRRFGVGCDQVLLVERATGDADFRYRIFNADGGEVEQCGNGARCFVIFVRAQALTSQTRAACGDRRRTDLPAPRRRRAGHGRHGRAAVCAGGRSVRRTARVPLTRRWMWMAWRSACPCCRWAIRMRCSRLPTWMPRRSRPRARGSRTIRAFPRRVNAGYMQVVDRATIRLRVWERGAGETWRAAPARARPWWLASGAACSIRRYACRRVAGNWRSRGQAMASRCG